MKFRSGGCSNKEDSLSNQANKQALIHLISERMRERGCHVIQAEKDADVDIVKAAVSMASFKTTTLIGDDTDLLFCCCTTLLTTMQGEILPLG